MGMFDFNDVKLSGEEIVRIAQRDGLSILRVAISSNGYRQTQGFWDNPDASSIYKGSEQATLVELIRKMARNGKGVVGIRSLYEGARRAKRVKGGNARLMARIKDEMIPEFEKMNLVCLIGDKIYVHPAIIGESWQPDFKTYEGEHDSRLPYHLRYGEDEVEKAIEFYRKAKSLLNGEH